MEPPISQTNADRIKITSPLLPHVDEIIPYLRDIFASGWVTNNGRFVRTLEAELGRRLGTDHLAVVTNGTVAIELAVRSLGIEGEIITTGFTFPATYQTLLNIPGVRPVFADIREDYTLDPDAVRHSITERTRAILAVHAFGYPCRVAELEAIAREHGLALIYDAAPSLGVTVRGKSIAAYGDVGAFSFHATKVFSTLEGGCVVARSAERIDVIKRMRNFGFKSEDEVEQTGVNGKMDEVRAAIGLAALGRLDAAIQARKRVVTRYLDAFREIPPDDLVVRREIYQDPEVRLNYAYFPILIPGRKGFNRDVLHASLRAAGIEARKYYYPAVTDIPRYARFIDPAQLPMTRYASARILCLPVHHEMTAGACDRVIGAVLNACRTGH